MTTATLVKPTKSKYNYENYKNRLNTIQVLEVYKMSQFKYEWQSPVTSVVSLDYLFDYWFLNV
jgi:hypothetical protein